MNIVREGRIPKWWLAAYAPDIPRAYESFQTSLARFSLSLTDLAEDIGVDQSTVSRWAVGRTRPTPEQMKALLTALQARIKVMATVAERTARAVEGLRGVTQAFEESLVPKGAPPVGVEGIRRAARKLHDVMNEVEKQHSPTSGRVR